MFNSGEVRSQFPILQQKVRGKDLVYLDSANTTLKPKVVIDRINVFYKEQTANVHRGSHYLSDMTTSYFEQSRETIKNFIGAEFTEEIIFTKGTTESINLVATSYGESFLNEGDELVLTELEHHANIVPWQILAERKKCVLKYIPVASNGDLELKDLETIISKKTKLVSISGCSNILGTLTPIEAIIQKAKSVGARVFLDAAQLISQRNVDVQKLQVDFLAFSSHKLFGPYGFGVLYGKKEILDSMPPYQYGGSMISEVGFFKTTFNQLPFKFEAGTPHIAGAIGLAEAINFFKQWPIADFFEHEQRLLKLATEMMSDIPEVELFGTSKNKASILSFTVRGIHHSDIGQILDQNSVAVRIGHHCTQPLLKKFGLSGTVRASISIYNNERDIEKFIDALKSAKRILL